VPAGVIVLHVRTKLGASDFASLRELSALDAIVNDHAKEQLRAFCSDYELGLVEASSLE
jgi:hypothetical protein